MRAASANVDVHCRGRFPLSFARLSPVFAALALALMGSACTQGGNLRPLATYRSAPLTEALVMPGPGAPPMLAVVERFYDNAVEQDIVLATKAGVSGQNNLRVRFFGPVDQTRAGLTALPEKLLGAQNLESELRSAFPGVPMQISPFYVQNRYGPFGYAVGRARSGDLCFFAWQSIRSSPSARPLLKKRGAIDLRLRMCDSHASEAQLLDIVYGLTITAAFTSASWNPYPDPLPPDQRLGRAAAPISPMSKTGFRTVSSPRAERPVLGARPQATASPDAEKPGLAETGRGIAVPPPPVPGDLGPPALVPPPPCRDDEATCRAQQGS